MSNFYSKLKFVHWCDSKFYSSPILNKWGKLPGAIILIIFLDPHKSFCALWNCLIEQNLKMTIIGVEGANKNALWLHLRKLLEESDWFYAKEETKCYWQLGKSNKVQKGAV